MNQIPNGQDNFEQRQELMRQEEAYRLKQEERRLKAARRRARFAWVRNTIILFLGALQILLGMRFFLRLTGANPENPFAQFVYNWSAPFMKPFATLFISPTSANATHIFDVNNLMAMLVYALVGLLALALVNYLQGRGPYHH